MAGKQSRMAALLTATTLGVTGLSVAAAPAASARPSEAVHVYITKTSMIRMDTQLRPGLRKFVVRSAADTALQLVRAHRGYSKREFARDANAGLESTNVRALRRLERNLTFVGGTAASPGKPGVLWSRLTRGRYWALDTNALETRARNLLTLRVGGRRVTGTGPHPDAVIRAIHEVDWAPRPRVIPTSGVMTFRNDSVDNHFILMGKIRRGKTFADVRAFIRQLKNGKNPSDDPTNPNVFLGTGVVSPGHRMQMRYDLPAGRYVLLCFWPDADMNGTPHVFMGMYRKIVLR